MSGNIGNDKFYSSDESPAVTLRAGPRDPGNIPPESRGKIATVLVAGQSGGWGGRCANILTSGHVKECLCCWMGQNSFFGSTGGLLLWIVFVAEAALLLFGLRT